MFDDIKVKTKLKRCEFLQSERKYDEALKVLEDIKKEKLNEEEETRIKKLSEDIYFAKQDYSVFKDEPEKKKVSFIFFVNIFLFLILLALIYLILKECLLKDIVF